MQTASKTFLLDRVQGTAPDPVLRITEIVHDGTRRGRYVVEMDEAVLRRILHFMLPPNASLPQVGPVSKLPKFSGEQCTRIVRSYLKGVSSKALAMQYGCKVKDIEDALRVEGIEVVDQDPPKRRNYLPKRRRR